jgi:hypothetical protein
MDLLRFELRAELHQGFRAQTLTLLAAFTALAGALVAAVRI